MTSNLEVTLTVGKDMLTLRLRTLNVTFYYGSLEDTTWVSGPMFKRRNFIAVFYLVTHTLLVMHSHTLFMVISGHTLGSELSNHP